MNTSPFRQEVDSGTSRYWLRMLNSLRYYWIAAKGYRLTPWKSPYLRWRFETYAGSEAADLCPRKFIGLTWKHRTGLRRFANWAAVRRSAKARKSNII
jgi:hypothetical protein